MKVALAKSKYRDSLQAYEDLNLVFLNAVFYNEEESQISKDASELKVGLLYAISGFVQTSCVVAASRQRMAGADNIASTT